MGKYDDHAIRSMLTNVLDDGCGDAGDWLAVCELTTELRRRGMDVGGVTIERNLKALVRLGGVKMREGSSGTQYAHRTPALVFGGEEKFGKAARRRQQLVG